MWVAECHCRCGVGASCHTLNVAVGSRRASRCQRDRRNLAPRVSSQVSIQFLRLCALCPLHIVVRNEFGVRRVRCDGHVLRNEVMRRVLYRRVASTRPVVLRMRSWSPAVQDLLAIAVQIGERLHRHARLASSVTALRQRHRQLARPPSAGDALDGFPMVT